MAEQTSNTKKKWLLGCGIGLIVLIIVGGIAFYLIYNKAKTYMQAFQGMPSNYTALMEKDDFQPPEDQIIKEKDIQLYIEMTQQIRQQMDEQLAQSNEQMDWDSKQLHVNLITKLSDLRKIQANVLKQHDYSLKKYKWITRQLVTIHGGKVVEQMNMLLKAMDSEQQEIKSTQEVQAIPQANLDLFNRYEKDIQDIINMWILGI